MNAANIKADILKLCPKGNVYEEHEKFIKTFDPKLRTDENIVLILCAITLFCPDRQSVIHKDVIKLEQVIIQFAFVWRIIESSPRNIFRIRITFYCVDILRRPTRVARQGHCFFNCCARFRKSEN